MHIALDLVVVVQIQVDLVHLDTQVRLRGQRGERVDLDRIAGLALRLEVDNVRAPEVVESLEGKLLGDLDIVEHNVERPHAQVVRVHGPGEGWVVQEIGGEAGELALVRDLEVALGVVVRHTLVGRGAHGRQIELGDIVALPVDIHTARELELRVEGTGIEQLAMQRHVEAVVGHLGEVAHREGQLRAVHNVLHDRRTHRADEVEGGAVRVEPYILLLEVEVRLVVVQLVGGLNVQRNRHSMQQAQDGAKHVKLAARMAAWRIRVGHGLHRGLGALHRHHLVELAGERTDIRIAVRGTVLNEGHQVLRVEVHVQLHAARGDPGVARCADRRLELLINHAQVVPLVVHLGVHLEQVDRRGERVVHLQSHLGPPALCNVGRDHQTCLGDQKLMQRRDDGRQPDTRQRALERVNGRRVHGAGNDRVRRDALHVVLQQLLARPGFRLAVRVVVHIGGHLVHARREHQVVDVCVSDAVALEVQVKGHVLRTDGDVRRVVEPGVHRDKQVRRIPVLHVQVRHIRGPSVEVLQTQKLGAHAERYVGDGHVARGCAGLGVCVTMQPKGDRRLPRGVGEEAGEARVLVLVRCHRHVAELQMDNAVLHVRLSRGPGHV